MRAQRRGWRYFATRLNGDGTETFLDPDIPLEGVEIDDVLSGDNGLRGTISPRVAKLIGSDGLPLFDEWSTAIYAENDGDIRGGGILTQSGFQGPDWSIECTGFTGYGRDMPYTGSGQQFVQADPIDCARAIWTHLQGQPGGNIGLSLDDTDTNGKVKIGTTLKHVEFDPAGAGTAPVSFDAGPYKLNWYTNHDLQGSFDDLAADTPFDYHEKHYWKADGSIGHFLEIGYPRLGRRREDLRFVYGVNLFDVIEEKRDGQIYASGTMVLGAGTGGSANQIWQLVEPPTRPWNLPRRIAVVTDDTITSQSGARRGANAENQWRRTLNDVDSVMVRNHKNAELGAVSVGDEIRLEGRGEWLDIDMWVRVLSIAIDPLNTDQCSYTVARVDKLVS